MLEFKEHIHGNERYSCDKEAYIISTHSTCQYRNSVTSGIILYMIVDPLELLVPLLSFCPLAKLIVVQSKPGMAVSFCAAATITDANDNLVKLIIV